MEAQKCKLCSKKFANGKALGGHMRSHLLPLPIPPKIHRISERTISLSSSSDDEIVQHPEPEIEEEDEKCVIYGYGLRENPRKSFRLADPDSAFAFTVQDRESETESKNSTFMRSKRSRKARVFLLNQPEKMRKLTKPTLIESEQMSSVSNTTPDEDVAMSLMMLSRDIWDRSNHKEKAKINNLLPQEDDDSVLESQNARKIKVNKLHECPFCYKVFKSGQALGGHKKSHFLKSRKVNSLSSSSMAAANGKCWIDLNFPAPIEDDDSLVFDSES